MDPQQRRDVLEYDTVTGDNTVTGDPAEDGFWKVEPLTKDNKKLVLTSKKDIAAAPVLAAEMTGSGNERIVNVKVSGDVLVKSDSWRSELLSVVAPGSVSVSRESATQNAASFKVLLGPNFKSGTLRVYAKNTSATLEGSVNVDLKAASGGGGDNGGGGKNPGGEKKGSSGGGCDAGFGGLALALAARCC